MKILRLVLKIMFTIASKSPFTSKYLNFQQIYKSNKMATDSLNSKRLRISLSLFVLFHIKEIQIVLGSWGIL